MKTNEGKNENLVSVSSNLALPKQQMFIVAGSIFFRASTMSVQTRTNLPFPEPRPLSSPPQSLCLQHSDLHS